MLKRKATSYIQEWKKTKDKKCLVVQGARQVGKTFEIQHFAQLNYEEVVEINFKQTKVGDRYVLEEMLKNGYNLGGEQSGHIIYLDYNPTGDGILTSLMLVQILLETNQKPSEASKVVKIYPQVLINAKVASDKKYDYEKDPEIKEAIEKLTSEFSGNGRVLIRPSGTEPLVRVMIEGEDQEMISKKAREIADLIEKKLK